MDSAAILALLMVALAATSILLAGWMYVLYKFGNLLARRIPLTIPYWTSIIGICMAWIPVSSLLFAFPIDRALQLGLFFATLLLNAYPNCIGFAAARYFEHEDSDKRFGKNVDDWLAEWECPPPERGDIDLKSIQKPPETE